MSNGSRRRPGRAPERRTGDIWRPVPPLPAAKPIVPASDPTVLVRSLGDPPLPSHAVVAGHYVATVIERAAALATALAASADLLAPPEEE